MLFHLIRPDFCKRSNREFFGPVRNKNSMCKPFKVTLIFIQNSQISDFRLTLFSACLNRKTQQQILVRTCWKDVAENDARTSGYDRQGSARSSKVAFSGFEGQYSFRVAEPVKRAVALKYDLLTTHCAIKFRIILPA